MKGAGEAVGAITSGLGDLALKLRSAITGKLDPRLEAELNQKLLELEASGQAAQAKINEVEAASPKLFIAGARPAILWICAAVLFYSYIASPVLRACGAAIPEISIAELWPLMTGLLGLSGMRSYEKIKGAAGNH
jgi:hypothetical protein